MSAVIRLARHSDARAIAEIYRPIVATTAVSFETEPPDAEEMRRRIGDTLPSHPWLVCERGNEIAGYAYATRHRDRAAYRWSVDTSVYVLPSHHRCGVGRGLYSSLFAILRAQGFFNAFVGISLPNPGSVGLHERVGFQPLGIYRDVGYKLGQWHDVGWWQLTLQPATAPVSPPHDLGSVRAMREWEQLLAAGVSIIRQ